MSGDYSRFGFDPFRDYCGVLLEQGRPLTDCDWNDLVAQINRRLQAGTLDASGQTLVAAATPDAFRISIDAQLGLLIGRGRMYVHGLLAENHGIGANQWDAQLAELHGSDPVPYGKQRYLPNAPAVPAAPYVVYLDVWRREVTQFEDHDIVEKALGVDTTTRLQTVPQVKLLGNVGNVDCSTPLDQIPGWTALTAPSAGRLSTATGQVPGDANPCLIPPTGGYKGLENQLYRVEIHDKGPLGTATFKWSRDNASVETRAMRLIDASNIVVESIGKDGVLRFSDGDWIEITDDWLELNGLAGQLRKIKVGHGVDDATRTITLDQPLTGNPFPVDAQGNLVPDRHTRVRRWDQKGKIFDKSGNVYSDLNAAGNSGAIAVPSGGLQLLLENGILVSFDIDATGIEFHVGDYWVFAARTSDATVEPLDKAPPRGIHHHYARLSVVSSLGAPSDCRPITSPVTGDCECTACVTADGHNNGTFTIQAAIAKAQSTGGKVCLGPGFFIIKDPIKVSGVEALHITGHGQTVLVAPPPRQNPPVPAILIDRSSYVTLESFGLLLAPAIPGVVGAAGAAATPPVLAPGVIVQNSASVTIHDCQFYSLSNQVPSNPAIALGGFVVQTTIRQNSFAFWLQDRQGNSGIGPGTGVAHLPTLADTAAGPSQFLLTFDLYVQDNFMQCGSSGIDLDALSYHAWQVGITGNFIGPSSIAGVAVAGLGFPAPTSRVEITGNEIVVSGNNTINTGHGVVCGVGAARISDNDVLPFGQGQLGDGILLDAPLFPATLDGCQIVGNRISGIGGIGIEIRAKLSSAIIKQNTIQRAGGGGIVMTGSLAGPSTAQQLSIANNQLLGLIPQTSNSVVGVLQYALGIRLNFVAAAEIDGNVIKDLGMDTVGTTSRVAIGLIACPSARISGNHIINIGPTNHTLDPSAGVAVTGPPFDRADVSANVIRRSDTNAPGAGDFTAWLPLYIGPLSNFVKAFNFFVVKIADTQFAVIGEHAIAPVPNGEQRAWVRGNFLEAVTLSSVAAISLSGSCVFCENQCFLTPAFGERPSSLATLSAHMVVASNNNLTGGSTGLDITVDSTTSPNVPAGASTPLCTVVGNIVSAPIRVNNSTLDQIHGGAWAPMNVLQ